ncbi:hypothetical protein Nepgr_019882 [Nepenthes gracilis]|uniref:Uncharacterized protein n=1 Tax=Nepenthes gracilis TaxID=150966 RepID=A0AAD3SW53_NEPGR|nr:hypothetical protein Nepgr_019882 [Nepenthes gracilis]
MSLDRLFEDVSTDEAAEKVDAMISQVNVLLGSSILYERSIIEYKLQLRVWQECFEVSVEKFVLAGASPTDVAVIVRNHCSNDSALEGLGFRIEESIQAWNDMDDAKRWHNGVPFFLLEPFLGQCVSELYYALEQA